MAQAGLSSLQARWDDPYHLRIKTVSWDQAGLHREVGELSTPIPALWMLRQGKRSLNLTVDLWNACESQAPRQGL